jgi:hypothetical protein
VIVRRTPASASDNVRGKNALLRVGPFIIARRYS